MKKAKLQDYFELCVSHQKEHECGGYPYLHVDVLQTLISASGAKRILELGTGLGYSAAAMAMIDKHIHLDTIDQSEEHTHIAKEQWRKFGVYSQISQYQEKAEVVLPTLSPEYDLIFFDGYAPSMKFMIQFERLLRVGGLLVTANLYVKDPLGGKYLRGLKRAWKWQSGFFSDTAISVKLR